MVDTEHVLEQMRAANPAPSLEQLAVDDLDLVRNFVARERSTAATPVEEQPQMRPDPLGRRWGVRPVLVAGLAFVLVLGTLGAGLLLFRGFDETAAAGFTCPPGSTPNQPGPANQPGPPDNGPMAYEDGFESSFATFDAGSGQVLMLMGDALWTFDVCTNIWATAPGPPWTTAPRPGNIGYMMDFVYDVDSDRAIVFAGYDDVVRVGSYEPATQTWTVKSEFVVPDSPFLWLKAAYDPVTGLVVLYEPFMSAMWIYDVDTDTWTEVDQGSPRPGSRAIEVFSPGDERNGFQLNEVFLTYDASVDRLVAYMGSTWEFDIRAGRWEEHATDTNLLQGFGWWPTAEEFVYDEANQVSVFFGDQVTTYDASERRWTPQGGIYSRDTRGVPPMIYDPVNERIVMTVGATNELHYRRWPRSGVIAYDVATGEWITLLDPTTE